MPTGVRWGWNYDGDLRAFVIAARCLDVSAHLRLAVEEHAGRNAQH